MNAHHYLVHLSLTVSSVLVRMFMDCTLIALENYTEEVGNKYEQQSTVGEHK